VNELVCLGTSNSKKSLGVRAEPPTVIAVIVPLDSVIDSTGPLAMNILSIPPLESLQSKVNPAVKFEHAIVNYLVFLKLLNRVAETTLS
jgi:hypothetical protein